MGKFQRSISAIVALLFAAVAYAHHSGAIYDGKKTVTIVGTVTQFHWANPHGWLDLDVAGPQGESLQWNIELAAPQQLVKLGFRKSNPKVGDKVTVIAHPMRDGRRAGAFVGIKLADGTMIGAQTGY